MVAAISIHSGTMASRPYSMFCSPKKANVQTTLTMSCAAKRAIPATIHTPSITIPALMAAIFAEEEWTGGFCRVHAGMVFYTRESTYTGECPMDAKEEKKEEYYKGKEVKGKLEKKKEEYVQGQGSQRRKIAVHLGKPSHDRAWNISGAECPRSIPLKTTEASSTLLQRVYQIGYLKIAGF